MGIKPSAYQHCLKSSDTTFHIKESSFSTLLGLIGSYQKINLHWICKGFGFRQIMHFVELIYFTRPAPLPLPFAILSPQPYSEWSHVAKSKLSFRISSNLQSGGNSAIAETHSSERYREGRKTGHPGVDAPLLSLCSSLCVHMSCCRTLGVSIPPARPTRVGILGGEHRVSLQRTWGCGKSGPPGLRAPGLCPPVGSPSALWRVE